MADVLKLEPACAASLRTGRASGDACPSRIGAGVVEIKDATAWRRRKPALLPKYGLTPREVEVVELLYLTNADIAGLLGISVRTIHAHVRSIFLKLSVETRAQALAVWIETERKAA